MSDILIRDMEMPKEYGPHEITITLFVRDDGTASLWGKEVFIPHEPLEVVTVPPHGRLIVEDDAIETAWMILAGIGYRREENPQLEQTVREVYATAPTIEVE